MSSPTETLRCGTTLHNSGARVHVLFVCIDVGLMDVARGKHAHPQTDSDARGCCVLVFFAVISPCVLERIELCEPFVAAVLFFP